MGEADGGAGLLVVAAQTPSVRWRAGPRGWLGRGGVTTGTV